MRSALLIVGGMAMLAAGCAPASSNAPKMDVTLAIDPAPPKVGTANALVTVTDNTGVPVEGAAVKLEGNMNHAGMKPSFADLTEVQPGQYEGTLEFTMGGDWFVLVTVKTSDGMSSEVKVDVPGVSAE